MSTALGNAGQTSLPESPPVSNAVSEHQTLLKYEAIHNNAPVGIAFTEDRAFSTLMVRLKSYLPGLRTDLLDNPARPYGVLPKSTLKLAAWSARCSPRVDRSNLSVV